MKGAAEGKMFIYHHLLTGHEFEQTRIPWRREGPGMLQSMGSQRVRHDVVTVPKCNYYCKSLFTLLNICQLQFCEIFVRLTHLISNFQWRWSCDTFYR